MTCITDWCPCWGSTAVLIWALAPNGSHCLHSKPFYHISPTMAYPNCVEVIFTSFFWLATVASPKILWSSQDPVFPLSLPCLTAHPRLLSFPQISLSSFYTSSVLSLLPAQKALRVPSMELLAPSRLSTDTFSEGWRRLGFEQFRAASSLQMVQFGSYMNIAIPFLFVAQLGSFQSEK